jgi:hypothetical protein
MLEAKGCWPTCPMQLKETSGSAPTIPNLYASELYESFQPAFPH